MRTMMQILRDLTPLNRAVCSRGYDRAVAYLQEILPFRVISIPSSYEHNGWVIPPCWDVEEAKIVKDGRVIYDGTAHPLGMVALSSAFCGTVDLQELKRHLHFDPRNDDSIPFHYRQQFRSWSRDWGFCVPKRLYDQLVPGDYEVTIRTVEAPGELKILEYRHPGMLDWTVVLGGNLDHAGVANDGLAGSVVGIEVLRRLQNRKTKFSYSLVLSPGIIGSEFYLANLSDRERGDILEGIFLEMLGSPTQLALQESRRNMASLSNALKSSLDRLQLSYRTGAFQTIIVNDEYVWENYGIPMLSLSRFPYLEYHSSRDRVENIRENLLAEAVDVVMGAVDWMENSPLVVRKFKGNVCLSNPKYDLYVDYGQVALGDTVSDKGLRMRRLMDLVPSLERPASIRAIADNIGLPEADVLEYLKRWHAKGLIELT